MDTQDGYVADSDKYKEQVEAYDHEVALENSRSFNDILHLLPEGIQVRRAKWGRAYLTHIPMRTQFSSATNKNTKYLQYIEYTDERGDKIPWCPTVADRIATDWEIL